MAERLAGKTAIITGGAGGIGVAIARLFLSEGARVAIIDRADAALEDARRQLATAPGAERLSSHACDISDEAGSASAVDTLAGRLGGLAILVNNAAVRDYAALGDAGADAWHRVLSVNLIGAGLCSRAALPHLRCSGAGSIVNVSSVFALAGRTGMGIYDASKAGMVSMTKTLAIEEARHGVRVNAVCPGSVLTDFILARAAVRGLSETELRERGHMPCPMDRWGLPEEIARPVLWLASDEASFVTGAILPVDGGLSAC